MITITREWLQKTIADMESARDDIPFGLDEDGSNTLAAFKLALASLEAKPMAWTDEQELRDVETSGCGYLFTVNPITQYADPFRVIKLFTVPPAPVVPDEIEPDDGNTFDYVDGWNACRAAMLQGSQPVSNRDEVPEEKGASLQLRNLIRQRHAEWSDKTFGNVGPIGPLKHLSKEALEAVAEPDDLSEWADMQFLLWDAQRRASISDGEITAAMEEKLKVNMARQWPEPKDGEPRLHIKEKPEPVVTLYRDGIEAAAKWIDQQREAYDSEHGRHDPDTGSFEFGNDAQRDYSSTLAELAEGIRALHPNAGSSPARLEAWTPVNDRLPEPGVTVLVYTPPLPNDAPDTFRIDFDYIDPDGDDPEYWFVHGEHYEHYCCVACEGMSGPSEKAPYTHWMPIPAIPQQGAAPCTK